MSADGDSDALSGLVGGGESSGLTPAGQSPPSVWPPPMPASQTVGGFLSSQEMAEGQAVVPPEAQVMALNAHFRDGGRIFGEDHGKFIKALSKYIPWMSKTLAGGTVDDQIPCVGIDRTCESDTKKVLEDAGLPRLEKMPAFCLKDIALTGSREGEVIQALSEIPKNTIIGAIGGAVGLRPRSSTYNQINNEKRFPRLFGVECKEKNLFLHLYNGGNSIFYYLSHACSPVNAIALPSMSAPCKEHGVEEKTLKVMTIAQHANPLTPNVRLEFATVGNTLYCFVKATRNLVAKDVLRLDWRCYAELQEKWHGPPKEVCNCGAKECRQVRVGSKNPAYFWSATKRFIAFPKGHHVQLLRPITSSNKEVAEHRSLRACATIPGLARPLHPGDFVVILFPDGDEEESRPAQVVYIEDKPTPMSKQAFFTYRLCEWAANDRLFKDADKAHPRGIYLTPTLWEFNHIFIRTLLPVVVLSRKESAEACNVSCSSLDVYVQGWATNRGDPGDAGDAEEFLEHGDEPMSPDVLTHFVKGGAGKRTVGDVKAVAWGHEYIEPPAGFFRPAESRVKGERDSRATKGSPIEIDSDGLEIEKLHDSDEVGYDEDLILKLQRAVKALPTLENIKTAVDELLQEHLNTTAAAAPAPGKRGESSKGKRGESSKGKQGESSPQKRVATPAWATELTTLVTTGFGATCTANLAEQILRLLQDPRDQAPKWKVELEKLDAILKHTVPTTEEVANMVIASNNDVKSKFEQRFEDERTSSSEHQDLLSKVLQEVRNLRSELRLLQSQTPQPSQPPSINYWAPPYHGQGLQMIPQQWAPSEPQFSPTPTPLAIIPAAATPSQKMTFAAPSLVSPAAATPSQFMAASTATPSHVMPGAMATRTIPAAIAASPVMPAAATPPVAATASPVMLVGTPSEEVRTQKRKFGDGESTSDAWMNWFADFGVVDAEKIPAIVHMLVKLNCRVETCSDGITRDLVYEECQRHGLAPVALKRVQLGLSTYAKLIQ